MYPLFLFYGIYKTNPFISLLFIILFSYIFIILFVILNNLFLNLFSIICKLTVHNRTESILPGNENILSISKNNYLYFDIYYSNSK